MLHKFLVLCDVIENPHSTHVSEIKPFSFYFLGKTTSVLNGGVMDMFQKLLNQKSLKSFTFLSSAEILL